MLGDLVLLDGCAEGPQRAKDTARVLWVRPNQNVQVAGRAGHTVDCHGMGADNEELGARVDESPEHVEEILVEAAGFGHGFGRRTRPGA